MEQAIVFDTPEKIAGFRLLQLHGALKLEANTGMKMSRGRTAYAIVKEEFGFKGNKKKVLRQLDQYLWDHQLRLNECAVYSEDQGWVYVRRGESGFWKWADTYAKMSPEEFNEQVGATDKEQRCDMVEQSMFGWRVS